MTTIKCLVWDLDDTVWDGVVVEGDAARPRPAAVTAIRTLDRRGVLQAVASRGDHGTAHDHLSAHGLADYFCALEIGWGAKSQAVRRIAEALNIGLDTVAFIDNDPLERAEVAAALPEVRCYPASRAGELAALPEFRPDVITPEAGMRRRMYQAERRRVAAEEEFAGTPEEFLTGLGLVLNLRRATEDDIARAHELTVRTHQLNTTGITYDERELRELTRSPDHEVLVAGLTDRFGHYGTIGLSVTEFTGSRAVLHLLLMSCRVMSRRVGSVLLDHVMRGALERGLRPCAWFVPTDVNRIMLVTLRFAGFRPAEEHDGRLLLDYDPGRPLPPPPGHVRIVTDAGAPS
ncbi:HAD-IIIC family phosphatase [Streptomyces sp. NPDC005876]|uniref:HAD-IIIC family phosphatase n=1 Tax=unclassified Streptomyces TaxID=2593676 RepID=UPI0033DCB03B